MNKKDLKKYCKLLIKAFHGAPVCQTFGMRLEYNEDFQAILNFPYSPKFNHGMGAIHGSVFAMLLDNAGWFAAAPHYGKWVVTVEYETRLLEPVFKQDMYSIGKIIRLGSRLATCEMQVFSKNPEQLVAVGSGTFAVVNQSLDPLKP